MRSSTGALCQYRYSSVFISSKLAYVRMFLSMRLFVSRTAPLFNVRVGPRSLAYTTAVRSWHFRPWDSATPACVTYPLYVLTPPLSAGCRSQALSRPWLASSSR